MVTKFTSQPHAWRLVSIGIGSFFCYSRSYSEQRLSRMCGHCALTICLFSGLRGSLLRTDLKVCVSTVCVGDMRVSLVQVKGRQHHLSENIGPAIARTARPAPPALSERNECVKETVPLNYSRFKVQA